MYAVRDMLIPHQILNLKFLYQFSRLFQPMIFNLMKTEYEMDKSQIGYKVIYYCWIKK